MKITFKDRHSRVQEERIVRSRSHLILGYFKRFFCQCLEHDDCAANGSLGIACGKSPVGKDVVAIAWDQLPNQGPSIFMWKLRTTPILGFVRRTHTFDFYDVWGTRTDLSQSCDDFERHVKGLDLGPENQEIIDELFLKTFGSRPVYVTVTREDVVVEVHDERDARDAARDGGTYGEHE